MMGRQGETAWRMAFRSVRHRRGRAVYVLAASSVWRRPAAVGGETTTRLALEMPAALAMPV